MDLQRNDYFTPRRMKAAGELPRDLLRGQRPSARTAQRDSNQGAILRGFGRITGWSATRLPLLSGFSFFSSTPTGTNDHGRRGAMHVEDFRAWVTGPPRKANGAGIEVHIKDDFGAAGTTARRERLSGEDGNKTHPPRKSYKSSQKPFDIKGHGFLPKNTSLSLGGSWMPRSN